MQAITEIKIDLQNQLEENINVHRDIIKMSKDVIDAIKNIINTISKITSNANVYLVIIIYHRLYLFTTLSQKSTCSDKFI